MFKHSAVYIDQRVVHESSGKRYLVEGTNVKYKHDGKWYTGIQYRSLNTEDMTLYVRGISDFKSVMIEEEYAK